jgi:hypothetical protein
MTDGEALPINPAKEHEAPFPCPACRMVTHAPVPGYSIINRPMFSQIICVHPDTHECPFCHTILQLVIAPCQPPIAWVPVSREGGIETPAQATMQ